MRWCIAPSIVVAALLGAPLSGQEGSQAPEPAAAESVVLMVTDHAGMPVEGAKFVAEWSSGKTAEVATAATGEAQVPLDDPFDAVDIRLADARFVSAPREQDSVAGRRLLGWTLFRSDAAAMAREERAEFARVWSRVAVRDPWPADPTETEKILRMVSSLRDDTVEGPPSVAETTKGTAFVMAKAVDGRGRPVAAALARLFVLDVATGRALTLGVARTDEHGVARFAGVVDGVPCRVEFTDGDAFGRGPLAIAGRSADAGLVVLRPRSQTITGFVFDADGPAADTIVRATVAGGAPLATTTDASGFFSIGPVAGAVELSLVRGTARGAMRATWTARGGDEIAVPLQFAGSLDGM